MQFDINMRGRQLRLSAPVVMGILNVTPDSFSDGGNLASASSPVFRIDLDKCLRRAEQMRTEGAVFIDIGGESTRPGARPVSVQEELDRVVPVIERIAANVELLISVDTSTPLVMTAAAEAGAVMVNDVRALQREGAIAAAGASGMAVCLMHMRGEPDTMQQNIEYTDVVEEVTEYLGARAAAARAGGIDRGRLILDPGFGFGKTVAHNYQLLAGLPRLAELGYPLLVGISRKSMIGTVTGRPVDQRLAGSIAATALALDRGAMIVRTHDVAATLDAIGVHCRLRHPDQGLTST